MFEEKPLFAKKGISAETLISVETRISMEAVQVYTKGQLRNNECLCIHRLGYLRPKHCWRNEAALSGSEMI